MSGTVENAIFNAMLNNFTPNVIRSVKASNAGNTAIWSPSSGKRFVLLAYTISATSNIAAAVAGILDVALIDGASNTQLGDSLFIPGTAGSNFLNTTSEGLILLGSGYTSGVVGNVLSVNLSFALTSGVIHVLALGREI